ncbi:type I methionyl aminopeptidase [Ruminococcaceae bacterium OttesenSCG-928-A16]|nr:type I methionyl aminopeptidase [Ruminococcaceae bacterium OttesenSCG-928-A16]
MIEIKTRAEIDKMQVACRISAQALALGGSMVRPGVSTAEIDNAIEKYIISQGARPNFKGYGGFPGSACISLNDTVIHGIPSAGIVLQPGDIVSIDTGAVIDGYHGDNAATFACGEISKAAQTLLDVTEASLYKGIEAAQAGNRVGDIGYAVQSYVEGEGFSVVRSFVGHGVGRKLHEDPEVPNFGRAGHGPRLVPGMVIAIEPMINEKGYAVHVLDDEWTVKTNDGGLSAHFEHTIAITKDGPIILTKL